MCTYVRILYYRILSVYIHVNKYLFFVFPSLLQIPNTINVFSLDITAKTAREQLRKEFLKNANVRDPRVIDMLVIKVHAYVVSLFTHTHTHTHVHTCMYACMHTHTCTQYYTHMHTHACMHACTHIHAQVYGIILTVVSDK